MKNKNAYALCILLLAMAIVGPSYAAFISPTKVFIQSNQTSSSISITNNSEETVVYTFEWERRVRSTDGTGVSVLKPGETATDYQPADPYLIFSPRKTIVRQGETQRVRIFARRPKDMPDGEYRSHFKITSESTTPMDPAKPLDRGFGGSFRVKPAVSIPVMLRTGKTLIDMKATSVRTTTQNLHEIIEVTIQNNSTRSVYGKGFIRCLKADSTTVEREINGFRIYSETKNTIEKFSIPKDLSLSSCTSAELKLVATREPDYSRNPILVVKVK